MPLQTVTYIIGPDGKVEISVEGVAGNSCKELTKKVEQQLGEVKGVEYKSEYYQEAVAQEDRAATGDGLYKS